MGNWEGCLKWDYQYGLACLGWQELEGHCYCALRQCDCGPEYVACWGARGLSVQAQFRDQAGQWRFP
eukprot:3773511-Amphidinium_carterae.1